MLQEDWHFSNKVTALGEDLSVERDGIRRRQLVARVVKCCVSSAALEDTVADRSRAREAIHEVLNQLDEEGKPLFSKRDRLKIIEWVDWKLSRVYGVADVLYGDDLESQNSDESHGNEKDDRSWTPDFRKILSS